MTCFFSVKATLFFIALEKINNATVSDRHRHKNTVLNVLPYYNTQE